MNKYFWNPFTYIAGAKSLIWGLVGMLVMIIISYFLNIRHEDFLNMHLHDEYIPLWRVITDNILNWLLSVSFLALAGKIVSQRSFPRMIDLLGTLAFARIPLILVALSGLLPFPDVSKYQPEHIPAFDLFEITIFGILIIFFDVLYFIWLFKAYKICFNLAGGRLYWSFFGAMIAVVLFSTFPFINNILYS